MHRFAPARGLAFVLLLSLSGCPAPRTDGPPDVGPFDAPRFDAPGLDTGATDAPSSLDDAGPIDGSTMDGGPTTMGDAPDAPRVSMPCMAIGACDPFDTTSCALGQGCLLGAAGTECMTLAAATARAGEACTRPDACEPGTACLSFAAEGFRCHRMCPDGSIGHCGAGSTCSGSLGDACVRVCRPLPVRCDIYTQDCAVAALACSLADNFETGERYTGCRLPGMVAEGGACGGAMGSCDRGLVCVAVDGVAACRRICREDGTAPSCTTPQMCVGRTGGWNVTFCRVPAAP